MKSNLQAIKGIVMNTHKKLILDPINNRMEKRFNLEKEAFLAAVRSHPVSQELIDWTTPSKFLNGGVSGSLFGFIGFPASYQPVNELIEYLRTNVRFLPAAKITVNGITSINYTIPSKEDYVARFPFFWQRGLSWVNGIEDGISGLGYFLSKRSSSSRSTEGVQSEYPVNAAANFSSTPFLTPLFENLKERLSR